MVSISLFVELLRTRPRVLFWAMAALQIALWTLVPVLFFSAPPGELPEVLAIGHEFQLGTEFGPPLAFWLADIVYSWLGLFGVYLLSQLCIVITYWAVLSLGRAIVGETHAVIAVLLMAGVAVFSVPTPEFGPSILATPLWALILMHYWQAVGQGRRLLWLALGLEAGLLLLTTYSGLILLGLLALFTLVNAKARAEAFNVEPMIAGVIAVAVLFPYLIWLDLAGGASLLDGTTIARNLRAWLQLTAVLAASHVGLAVLAGLARSRMFGSPGQPPEVTRVKVDPAARQFVYFFALAPVLAMGLFVLFTPRTENFITTPLVVMSGLAVVVAAGERIRIEHQYLIGPAWAALFVLPPLFVVLSVAVLPWIYPVDLRVSHPAAEMGRFFAENFQRRTGRPLAIVTGDQDTAALVALSAPSRPSLYIKDKPVYAPTVQPQDIDQKGAVVLWAAADATGRPPPEIMQQYPNLVAEVPRAFERRFQGFLPVVRVGWGMIRPRTSIIPPLSPQ